MKADLENAYVEFVAARRNRVRRIAYALCGDWGKAEDLTQIALEKAYVAWPRIHRRGAEEAYVRKILVRASVDESRRPWRRERVDSERVTSEQQRPVGNGPGRDLADEVVGRSTLVEALATLPAQQRRVVVLRHLWDLSVADTATELGISEGTVKSYTSRALAALEEKLVPTRVS